MMPCLVQMSDQTLVPLWVYRRQPCRLGDAGSMTFLPWQQHRVLQQHVLLLLLLLRASQQQHEEVVVHRKPSDRVVGGAELHE